MLESHSGDCDQNHATETQHLHGRKGNLKVTAKRFDYCDGIMDCERSFHCNQQVEVERGQL